MNINYVLLDYIKQSLRRSRVPADEAIEIIQVLEREEVSDEFHLYFLLYDLMYTEEFRCTVTDCHGGKRPATTKHYVTRAKPKQVPGLEIIHKHRRALERVFVHYPNIKETYQGRRNLRHCWPIARLLCGTVSSFS